MVGTLTEKNQIRDRTDGDWKDFFEMMTFFIPAVLWWFVLSHMPLFLTRKGLHPKSQVDKKKNKPTTQRSVVCHETQWKGGTVANKVPIILEWIWTMMRKINCGMSGIGLELAPSPLAREQQWFEGCKQWMKMGNGNNKAETQRNKSVFLSYFTVYLLRTNKYVDPSIGRWYIVVTDRSAPLPCVYITQSKGEGRRQHFYPATMFLFQLHAWGAHYYCLYIIWSPVWRRRRPSWPTM